MTTPYPLDTQAKATPSPMLADSLYHVLGTGGRKSASGWFQRANDELIALYSTYEDI
jgi:hypothetical protein